MTVSLLDGETTRLWDAPVHTAALRWRLQHSFKMQRLLVAVTAGIVALRCH